MKQRESDWVTLWSRHLLSDIFSLYLCARLLIASSEWHLTARFIHTYWRVSAGPHLKSSGNSPEACELRVSGRRDQWWKEHFLSNAPWDYCWWHISRVNRRKVSSLGQLTHLIRSRVGASHYTSPTLMMRGRFTLDWAFLRGEPTPRKLIRASQRGVCE